MPHHRKQARLPTPYYPGPKSHFITICCDLRRPYLANPQNRGPGHQLVSAAEDFARQSGPRFMDLTVLNLRTELPPFYERLGYAVASTQPNHPDLAARVRLPCHPVRMSKAL